MMNEFGITPYALDGQFLLAADALTHNSMFGIPENARNIISKNGKNSKVVILGTKGFGSHLLDSKIHFNFNAIASVDDFRYQLGAPEFDS